MSPVPVEIIGLCTANMGHVWVTLNVQEGNTWPNVSGSGYRPSSNLGFPNKSSKSGEPGSSQAAHSPLSHLSRCSVRLVQQGLFSRILAIKSPFIPSTAYRDNGSAFLHIVSEPHKAHVYQVIPLYTSKNSDTRFKLSS